MGCVCSLGRDTATQTSFPTKPTPNALNVSSADVQPESGPTIVGHSRKLVDEYDVGKQVGKGHYGFVFEGVHRATGRRVAIKKIDRTLCTPFRIQEEIEILRRVGHHEFIVCLLDAFETPEHVEIVMELMEGGELYGRIASKGPYPEAKAALICRRLASAVRYLHRHGVVHRDLKPENLLLASEDQDDVVKLADFGLAKHLVNQTHMTTVCGTWAYSAPEVRIFRKPYNYKVDIWSLGVILFTMLGGYHPFDPYGVATEDELQDNVRKLKFDFDDEVWEKVSEEAKDLIVAMLRHDPKERPSAKRVLMHPWIAKFAPGGDDDLSPAASKSQSAVRKPPTKNSVDESLFVDPVGRSESKRRSGTGRNSNGHDANPSNRSSHHDRPSVHEDRDRGRQRHDSNSTWMSKSKRTLRPTHRPADAYEPVIASPDMKASAVRSVQRTSMKEMPMPDYRAGPRAEMSSRDVFTQQPGYSAVPSYKPTDSLHRDRSVVDSRKSGRGSHGANLEYNVSRSTVGMDAGVVFRPQKPMATSHQFGGNTILAVHQHHQDMRRGRSVGVDRDDLDDGADGWQDAEFDAYARRAVQSSYGFQGQPHRARDHELASSASWWKNSSTGTLRHTGNKRPVPPQGGSRQAATSRSPRRQVLV